MADQTDAIPEEDFEGYPGSGGDGDFYPGVTQAADAQGDSEPPPLDLSGAGDDADVGGEPQTPEEAIAQYVAGQVQEQLRQADPAYQAERAAEADREASITVAAAELVERYPALAKQPVADQTIADASRAAAELGRPEWADNPALWQACYEARRDGVPADGIAPMIAQRMAKAQLLSGSADGSGLGRRALPF